MKTLRRSASHALLFGALLLSVPSALAQGDGGLRLTADSLNDERGASPPLHFERLGVENGLSQNSIYTILQDSDGFMWFGTQSGLNCYDGYGFTTYQNTPLDSATLSGHNVFSLQEGRDGAIWVGTDHGVNRLDRATGSFARFLHMTDTSGHVVERLTWALLEDREGAVWAGTSDGLFRLDPATGYVRRYRTGPRGLRDRMAFALHEGADGAIWAGTRNGLCRVDGVEAATCFLYTDAFEEPLSGDLRLHVPSHPSVRATSFTDLVVDPSAPDVLWATTEDGLVRFDTRTGTAERLRPEGAAPAQTIFTDLAPDPERPGLFWIASLGGGLYRFDVRTRRFQDYRSGQVAGRHAGLDWLLAVHVDRFGTAWAGSAGNGLYKFAPGGSGFWLVERGTDAAGREVRNSETVRALAADVGGELWVGGLGGLERIDPYTGHLLERIEGLNETDGTPVVPTSILIDRDGTFWVGTYGRGLFRVWPETSRVRRYSFASGTTHGLASDFVSTLFQSDDGMVWVGTMDGLSRYDPASDRFASYQPNPDDPNSLSHSNVSYFLEDAAGTLWVATFGGGLNRFDGNGFTHFQHRPFDPDAITTNYIMALHERAREPGVLWLATAGGGLVRFDVVTGHARHFVEGDGLIDQTLWGILEDKEGRLWLSGNRGISRFDPATEAVTKYHLGEGPQAGEYNYHAHLRIPQSGLMMFGGSEGFDVFHPARLNPNPYPPAVVLTGLRLFDDPVVPGPASPLKVPLAEAEEVRLRHDQDMVTLTFAALHYKEPSRNRYAYRLDGFTDGWVEADTRREATFTNLDPGAYTFRVKAANTDGVWSEEVALLRLTVLPPWWATSWFRLLALAALAGLLYAAYALRVRSIRAHNRRLEWEVAERTSEVEAQKQQLLALDEMKSRFFANVSHEFRTPLTLIAGPLEAGLPDDPAERRQQEHLMLRSARRLLRLVNQLLDLAKLERGKLALDVRTHDLVPFLRGMVEAFTPLAERRHIALSYRPALHVLPVAFDAEKLEQVIGNLLSNALKFTPEGGKVCVAVRRATHEGAPAAEIAVKDTGPGIAKKDLERIFDRFEQVDGSVTRAHEGAGIGLALARELVELHGGTISAESELGFGSTFTVRLPTPALASDVWPEEVKGDGAAPSEAILLEAAAMSESPPVLAPSGEAPADADAPLVLLVEDSAEVRAFLRRHLASHYRLLEAADGAEALALARQHRPDLILSDVMMPGMDGLTLCRALKADERLRAIPLVLLTAKAADADAVEGYGCGADAYVTKPFAMDVLQARLAALIAARHRLRDQYARTLRLAPADIEVPAAEEAFLTGVLAAAEAHLGASTFGVDALAEAVGLSRRQLERRLKETLGEAPAALLRRLRMERAAQLLEAGAITVQEVAAAVGYRSASHFARAFREHFGHAPSEHTASEQDHADG